MNEQTDRQLLRAYVESRSEAAFGELVRRRVDFVYSAARRMVCDPHLAEDVTQGVFVALAKSADQLLTHPVLSGWLHRTAQNIAAQTVRTIERRRAREQEAAAMNDLLSAECDVSWEQIAPHLDAALGELSEPDRDALFLRYFECKSAREIAAILRISDEAAQKRVSRAVERLRELFAKHGVTMGASGLVVAISANAVQAAPVGLAVTISSAATLAGTTITTTSAISKAIVMSTLQKTIITAALTVAVGAGIYETKQAKNARAEVRRLQQQQAPLAEQIQQLQKERDDTAQQLAALPEENSLRARNTSELLKLRAEIARMRRDSTSQNNDLTTETALAWVARKEKLQRLFDENPENRIAELRFLTEKHWLDLAKDLNLDSEEGRRFAIHHVRTSAKLASAPLIETAINKFIEQNNGNKPTDVSELKPFFEQPIDDAILERYRILSTNETQSGWLQGMVLLEKAAVDKWQETQVAIGPTDYGIGSTPEPVRLAFPEELKTALKSYQAQNPRTVPADFNELRPYLTTPEQVAALNRLLNAWEDR